MHYRSGGAFASFAEGWKFESQTYVVTSPRTRSSKQEVTSLLHRKW